MTNDPFFGLLIYSDHEKTKSEILSGGVHVLKSLSGIDYRLKGVSIIVGKIVSTVLVSGISVRSASCNARLWVADLLIAYPYA